MIEQVQHKLQNAYVNPPEEVWVKITERIQNELMQNRIRNIEITPPSVIWLSVEQSLDKENRKPFAGSAPVRLLKSAIAAIIAGLIITLGFMYLPRQKGAVLVSQQINNQGRKLKKNSVPNNLKVHNNAIRTSINRSLTRSSIYSSWAIEYSYNNRENNRVRPVSLINISPIILRTKINVSSSILTEKAISTPPDFTSSNIANYITIISPNGEPVRISAKFLDVLHSIYNNDSDESDDPYTYIWKMRIKEWKKKIIDEAAFVPSAANFFDIFELTQLIKE